VLTLLSGSSQESNIGCSASILCELLRIKASANNLFLETTFILKVLEEGLSY
jgi:hypothetical protein